MTIDSGLSIPYRSGPRRLQTRSTGLTIRRETLVRVLLTGMVCIALWRATGMWYGYPSNFDEDGSVDPLPMKLLLYSLIPLIGLYAVLESRRFFATIRQTPVLIMIVIFCCAVSTLTSEILGASLRGAAAVVVLSLPVILFRARYGGTKLFQLLITFCIVSAFLNVLYIAAFPRFAIMAGSYAGMVKGLFYHKNIMGQFCAIAFVVLMPTRRADIRFSYRFLLRSVALLLTLGLILTSRSSTAVIMVGVGVGVVVAVALLQRVRRLAARSVAVFFLGVAFFTLSSAIYLGALAAIAEFFGKDVTFSGRTLIWEQLIPAIYERSLFGYGFALFRQPEVMQEFVRMTFQARSTHNTYLELALNIGIPGTATLIVFLFSRLSLKLVSVYRNVYSEDVQRKEIAVILLVMVGAMMEAGFMLAPLILWVVLLCALQTDTDKSVIRHPQALR